MPGHVPEPPPHTLFLAGLEPHSCLGVAAGAQPLLHPRDTPPQQRTAQHQGLRLHLGSGGDSRGTEVYPGWSGHGGGARSEAPSKLSGRAVKSHTQPSLDPRGHATLQMRTQILTSTLESTHTRIPPHTCCPSPAAHTHETHTLLSPRPAPALCPPGHSNFLSPQSGNVRSCPLGLNFFRRGPRDLTEKADRPGGPG